MAFFDLFILKIYLNIFLVHSTVQQNVFIPFFLTFLTFIRYFARACVCMSVFTWFDNIQVKWTACLGWFRASKSIKLALMDFAKHFVKLLRAGSMHFWTVIGYDMIFLILLNSNCFFLFSSFKYFVNYFNFHIPIDEQSFLFKNLICFLFFFHTKCFSESFVNWAIGLICFLQILVHLYLHGLTLPFLSLVRAAERDSFRTFVFIIRVGLSNRKKDQIQSKSTRPFSNAEICSFYFNCLFSNGVCGDICFVLFFFLKCFFIWKLRK